MKNLTKLRGLYVRCNTIGHISSGLEGIIERICDTEEDRNLGLSEDYGMINGIAVNLHNCVVINHPDLEDETDDMEGEREYMRAEANHRQLTEDEYIIYGLI